MRGLWAAAVGVVLFGCGGEAELQPTEEPTEEVTGTVAFELQNQFDEGCTFDRGLATCTRTAQAPETETIQMFSGCMTFNGTTFVAGQRVRTMEQTFLVVTTTTTTQHGWNGQVIDSTTTTERHFVSSRMVSDVCSAIQDDSAAMRCTADMSCR